MYFTGITNESGPQGQVREINFPGVCPGGGILLQILYDLLVQQIRVDLEQRSQLN